MKYSDQQCHEMLEYLRDIANERDSRFLDSIADALEELLTPLEVTDESINAVEQVIKNYTIIRTSFEPESIRRIARELAEAALKARATNG